MPLTLEQIETKLQPYVNEIVQDIVLNMSGPQDFRTERPLGLPSMGPGSPVTANQTAPAARPSKSRPAAPVTRQAVLGDYGRPLPLPTMTENELELDFVGGGQLDPNEPNPKSKPPISYFGQAGAPMMNESQATYGRQVSPHDSLPLPLPVTNVNANTQPMSKKTRSSTGNVLGLPSTE